MNTDKIISYAKNNWLKITIGLVVLVILIIILRKVLKSYFNRRRIAKETANTIVQIENASGKPAELSYSDVKTIANDIHASVAGAGTDTDRLVAAVNRIPTAADYFNVKKTYVEDYNSDMWKDIEDDVNRNGSWFMDSYLMGMFETDDRVAWGEINSHLNLIGVPENLR